LQDLSKSVSSVVSKIASSVVSSVKIASSVENRKFCRKQRDQPSPEIREILASVTFEVAGGGTTRHLETELSWREGMAGRLRASNFIVTGSAIRFEKELGVVHILKRRAFSKGLVGSKPPFYYLYQQELLYKSSSNAVTITVPARIHGKRLNASCTGAIPNGLSESTLEIGAIPNGLSESTLESL
jgi:hypothetical protein